MKRRELADSDARLVPELAEAPKPPPTPVRHRTVETPAPASQQPSSRDGLQAVMDAARANAREHETTRPIRGHASRISAARFKGKATTWHTRCECGWAAIERQPTRLLARMDHETHKSYLRLGEDWG